MAAAQGLSNSVCQAGHVFLGGRMASDLAQHVAAASTVLAGLRNSDPDAWARVSRVQREVVQHALSKKSLTMAELSDVATAVRVSDFAEEDQLGIFKAMATTKACNPSDATAQIKMQDFESVLHSIPEKVWDADGTQEFALLLMDFVLKLGLRNPPRRRSSSWRSPALSAPRAWNVRWGCRQKPVWPRRSLGRNG